MFDTLYSQIGAAFIVLVLGFAFLKGEETERIAAQAEPYSCGTGGAAISARALGRQRRPRKRRSAAPKSAPTTSEPTASPFSNVGTPENGNVIKF